MATAEVHKTKIVNAISDVRFRIHKTRAQEVQKLLDREYNTFSFWKWLREVGWAEKPGWTIRKFETVEQLEEYLDTLDWEHAHYWRRIDLNDAQNALSGLLEYLKHVEGLINATPDDFITLSDDDIRKLELDD